MTTRELAKRAEKARLRAMTVDRLLAKKIVPNDPIIGAWLREQTLALLYAPRGIGKTFLILSIALAIAAGVELLGWRVDKRRKVVILDGEMAAYDLQSRLRLLVKILGIDAPLGDYLRIVAADLQAEGIRDISTEEGQADIEDILGDAEVIIIDNLSALSRSGRENEAESWTPLQEWALRMRREGRTVIFVHHAGKGGGQRGTSRREDVLDTVISLRRPEDYGAADGARFEVHFEKARGFMGEDAEPFEARLTERGWVRAAIGNPLTDQILELHAEHLSQREIARRVGVSAATVNRIIKSKR
jgi:RecA-family ATPase/predicted XRE-type DNA-binding protein